MALTQQQLNLFETFGFLRLPGLVKPAFRELEVAFEDVLASRGSVHDGSRRTTVVPFIDQDERLCRLLDDPGIIEAASSLLGDRFNYVGGDGNYYSGDTAWHSDGFHHVGRFVKFAIYLDPVDAGSGALRVVPGSHRTDSHWAVEKARVERSVADFGIRGDEVPGFSIDSVPGDVIAFNHNLLHSSWGGGARRRMFTLNLSSRATSEVELDELKGYISGHARFWNSSMFGDVMVETASPNRRDHLEQVLQHQGHLPELVRRARAEMAAPANG